MILIIIIVSALIIFYTLRSCFKALFEIPKGIYNVLSNKMDKAELDEYEKYKNAPPIKTDYTFNSHK